MIHLVNISGGKDSATVALLARERGIPFDLWMADTGNESPLTWDYAHYVADFLGQPLCIARADFSERLAGKAAFVAQKWADSGVPPDRVARALEILRPSGNPFLDLCIWKGRFPSRRAQFCTEFLKREAIDRQALAPALERGGVVQWIGVRREESLNRRTAPMFRRVRVLAGNAARSVLYFQPIIHWSAQNVFSFQRALGLEPNPLYRQGFGRVGCFPCINAGKAELSQIGRRYPEVVERLLEWEALVKDASKRGAATFFASDVTPEGAALGAKARAAGGLSPEASAALRWPSADEVFEWAKTNRGGDRRQGSMFDLFEADDGLSCSSQYGLCE